MNHFKLTSNRLRLRFIIMEDLELIHELHCLAVVDQYNTLGIPANIAETRAVIEPQIIANIQENISRYTFAIERIDDSQFMGLFGLTLGTKKNQRAEVYYKLFPDYWNKGYATEALNLVLDYCFNKLALHRVEAGCAVANLASIAVLEKVGMTREGRGRQKLALQSGWSDNYEYAILKTDKRYY